MAVGKKQIVECEREVALESRAQAPFNRLWVLAHQPIGNEIELRVVPDDGIAN